MEPSMSKCGFQVSSMKRTQVMLHPSPTRLFKYHKGESKHTRINMKKRQCIWNVKDSINSFKRKVVLFKHIQNFVHTRKKTSYFNLQHTRFHKYSYVDWKVANQTWHNFAF